MTRTDLDYSRLAEAKALVAEGDAIAFVNCTRCQGMGISIPGHHAYCPECKGNAYISLPAWERWSWERKIDYWQGRCLLAEASLRSMVPADSGMPVEF